MMTELTAIASFAARETIRVLPVFLLSVAIGVLIRHLKLDAVIRRAFNARIGLAIVAATAVGAFSPFCSCTVVPVITGLLMSGVPLAPVMSFWIASPTMDPEIFALSVATLGWPLAMARLLATLTVSLGAGFVTLALVRSGLLAGHPLRAVAAAPVARPLARPLAVISAGVPVIAGGSGVSRSSGAEDRGGCCAPKPIVVAPATACCASAPAGAESAQWSIAGVFAGLGWLAFARTVLVDSVRLGRWLVLAFVLEAIILRYVPQAAIAQVLGQGSVFAVPLAVLVGIPLYLNNVSALPIVSGLLAQGMQPGAAVAFLIAGPVTTVPAMAAVWGIAQRRVFAVYLGVALGGALLLGLATNALLG